MKVPPSILVKMAIASGGAIGVSQLATVVAGTQHPNVTTPQTMATPQATATSTPTPRPQPTATPTPKPAPIERGKNLDPCPACGLG